MAPESTGTLRWLTHTLQCEWQVRQPTPRSPDVLLLLAVRAAEAAGVRSGLCRLDTAHPPAKRQREAMEQKMSSSLLLSRRCDGAGRGILVLGSRL